MECKNLDRSIHRFLAAHQIKLKINSPQGKLPPADHYLIRSVPKK